MKSKKGIFTLFSIFGLIFLLITLAIVGLLVFLGFQISDGIMAFFNLVKDNLLWIAGFILIIVFREPIRALIKKVFKI